MIFSEIIPAGFEPGLLNNLVQFSELFKIGITDLASRKNMC